MEYVALAFGILGIMGYLEAASLKKRVKALEDQGVDPFNLRPVGKGSHEPVADNGTEEGRAQNRRVEFIKR